MDVIVCMGNALTMGRTRSHKPLYDDPVTLMVREAAPF
jgi:hypothetical protein